MNATAWYAEASLISDNHVFRVGSLAQCVRKWTRLPEIQQSYAIIRLQTNAAQDPVLLARDEILNLAGDPALAHV